MHIKIKSAPPGEAPEQIRQAWVGLTLPILGNQPVVVRTVGVLTGPRSFFPQLLHLLLGRAAKERGYMVHALAAFEKLHNHNPAAAQWWRTHTPHLNRPGQTLIFDEQVCEVVLDITLPA